MPVYETQRDAAALPESAFCKEKVQKTLNEISMLLRVGPRWWPVCSLHVTAVLSLVEMLPLANVVCFTKASTPRVRNLLCYKQSVSRTFGSRVWGSYSKRVVYVRVTLTPILNGARTWKVSPTV